MKIRFTSQRSAPDVDQGIRVSYPPAKRTAYRLRWYLILLVVSSPLIYMVWSFSADTWLIEAPGYLEMPVYNIDAPISGRVTSLFVKNQQAVAKGESLIELSRPEQEELARMLQLEYSDTVTLQAADDTTIRRKLEILRESQTTYDRLFKVGAATRGELEAATLRLMDAESAYLRYRNELQQKKSQVNERKAAARPLMIYAPSDSVVLNINVQPGINVLEGTQLLTLHRESEPRIIALLPPRYAGYARTGQEGLVIWPNGARTKARIIYDGVISERMPARLQVFGIQNQGILVEMKLLQPLPDRLNVINLPVKVRFSRDYSSLMRYLGFDVE
jgi:multidrug efflux pump subunit AcrA (membrane-fusion protein)